MVGFTVIGEMFRYQPTDFKRLPHLRRTVRTTVTHLAVPPAPHAVAAASSSLMVAAPAGPSRCECGLENRVQVELPEGAGSRWGWGHLRRSNRLTQSSNTS
ncbi:hypothetical protein KSE_35610 [Kitasatospora setae KM-6054]|uniref:Uncharacterized protein n=1 Tax=Kitasatospora setae (strain ATCC 33774 / DSM 43861 / JCM 3304 / KCC A-0304 / NBRC 14216 / KM-6054) TaxID=452652 RepID=E4NDT5_KITSK|nr:hypothetical protein KSE_35610 [Kitasatospora setae KM-6054]